MLLLGYGGAALVGLGLAIVVSSLLRRPLRRNTVRPVDGEVAAPGTRDEELSVSLGARLISPLTSAFTHLGERVRPAGRNRRLEARLEAAGVSVSSDVFYAGKVLGAASGTMIGLLGLLLTGRVLSAVGVIGVVFAGAIGFLVPDVWLSHVRQRRQQQIRVALPEALDLLALAVRAGLGLEQGLAEVTREVEGPLGTELARMLKEQQLGRTRHEAITALKERNSDEDLQRLTAALLHADRLGTPIAQTLQVQANELRRRRRSRARETAGKAPVKLLVPLILFIFPAMFVVIIGPGVIGIMQNVF